MGPHILKSTDGGTCQTMESNQESKRYSHPMRRGDQDTEREPKQENNKSIE